MGFALIGSKPTPTQNGGSCVRGSSGALTGRSGAFSRLGVHGQGDGRMDER
jgi:hypothetical protein